MKNKLNTNQETSRANTQKIKSTPIENRYEVLSQPKVGPYTSSSKEPMSLLDPIHKENEVRGPIITPQSCVQPI